MVSEVEVGVKSYGTFRVSSEGVEVSEPEDYPAMYGGVVQYPDGSDVIVDDVLIRDKRGYEEFVSSLSKLYEKYYSGGVENAIQKLDKISNLLFEPKFVEFVKEFTTVVDEDDVEILKAGWSLAAKKYSRLVERAGIVGYEDWKEYEGLGRRLSEQINAHIWDLVFKRRTYKIEDLVNSLSREFGLDKDRAEVIVRTEMANIFNKAREWAYIEKTDAKKFVWVAKKDACELCKEVESRASGGVSLRKLKKIISDVGGEYAREWTVHPNCRCSFRKKYGGRKRWEKV